MNLPSNVEPYPQQVHLTKEGVDTLSPDNPIHYLFGLPVGLPGCVLRFAW
jgi:hypothetical protein